MYKIDLSINNFYAFLIELSFSLLFLVLFGSIHYNLTKSNKFNNLLNQKKWFNFIYFFFFGAFLALLTFGVSQLTSTTINIQIGLPAVILGLIFAMSSFYSNSIQIGAAIPTIFWVLVEYDGFSTMSTACWIRLIYVCVFCLLSFGIGFIKDKKWLVFLLGNIALAGIYLLMLIWVNDQDWVVQILEVLFGVLASLMFFAICKSLNKMFSNITTISRRAIYTDKHFLIPSLINEKFEEFVRSASAKQALVFTLDIKGIENEEIKEGFFKSLIEKLWDDHILYIKTHENKYGFIIIDDKYYLQDLKDSYQGNLLNKRLKNDPLSLIENKLNQVKTQFNIDGKDFSIKVRYYLSIYGVHAYDVNELLWFNQFMINNEDLAECNTIKLFNSNMINHIVNDKISYAALTQQVDLNEIDVELEKIKIKGMKETFICPRFYWTKKLTCDINSIMSEFDKQTASTLLRSLAVRSIEAYEQSEYKKKNKLLIYYPIEELTSSFFSTGNIIKKLRLYGVNYKDVIFTFDCAEIIRWPRSVIKHLKDFEEHKLSYFLVDLDNKKVLKTLKPTMVLLAKSNNLIKTL